MTFTPAYAEGLVCATHVTWCLACEKQLSFRLMATRRGGGWVCGSQVTVPLSEQFPAGAPGAVAGVPLLPPPLTVKVFSAGAEHSLLFAEDDPAGFFAE